MLGGLGREWIGGGRTSERIADGRVQTSGLAARSPRCEPARLTETTTRTRMCFASSRFRVCRPGSSVAPTLSTMFAAYGGLSGWLSATWTVHFTLLRRLPDSAPVDSHGLMIASASLTDLLSSMPRVRSHTCRQSPTPASGAPSVPRRGCPAALAAADTRTARSGPGQILRREHTLRRERFRHQRRQGHDGTLPLVGATEGTVSCPLPQTRTARRIRW